MTTILVVEDDEEFQKMLKIMLNRLGYDTVSALNGVEALHLVTYSKPDLIILDLMMPWASGDAVLGFVRSTQELKKIPVVVLSAHPNAETLAMQLEANGYLPKPVDLKILQDTLKQLLATPNP